MLKRRNSNLNEQATKIPEPGRVILVPKDASLPDGSLLKSLRNKRNNHFLNDEYQNLYIEPYITPDGSKAANSVAISLIKRPQNISPEMADVYLDDVLTRFLEPNQSLNKTYQQPRANPNKKMRTVLQGPHLSDKDENQNLHNQQAEANSEKQLTQTSDNMVRLSQSEIDLVPQFYAHARSIKSPLQADTQKSRLLLEKLSQALVAIESKINHLQAELDQYIHDYETSILAEINAAVPVFLKAELKNVWCDLEMRLQRKVTPEDVKNYYGKENLKKQFEIVKENFIASQLSAKRETMPEHIELLREKIAAHLHEQQTIIATINSESAKLSKLTEEISNLESTLNSYQNAGESLTVPHFLSFLETDVLSGVTQETPACEVSDNDNTISNNNNTAKN